MDTPFNAQQVVNTVIYWILLKLMIDIGLWKGEAAALKWSDIDLKNHTIRVDETLDWQPEEDEA